MSRSGLVKHRDQLVGCWDRRQGGTCHPSHMEGESEINENNDTI